MERDIAQLRSSNKQLGESLEWILDVLQTEVEVNGQERLHEQKHEALKSLCYVKDILIGTVAGIEASRLARPKREDMAIKPLRTTPPLEQPSLQQLTVSQAFAPSRGSSFSREPGQQNSVRSNLSASMGRLPARPKNMQQTSGKYSAGQKKLETSGDPLGVL
jgi:hypothetical protein